MRVYKTKGIIMSGMPSLPGFNNVKMYSSPFGATISDGCKTNLYDMPPLFPMMPGRQMYNYSMMGFGGGGHCCHDCGGGGSDSGMEKAILIGLGTGVVAGTCIAFAEPLGKFFSMVGKGIAVGAKAAWNGISSGASWCWNGIKNLFTKKADKTPDVAAKVSEEAAKAE